MMWEMLQRGLQRSTIHDSFHKLRGSNKAGTLAGVVGSGVGSASVVAVAPPEDCEPIPVSSPVVEVDDVDSQELLDDEDDEKDLKRVRVSDIIDAD